MNIIVCVKQVVDVSEMRINPQDNKPILTGLAKKINDIDKNAVEEAIKIKEKHGGKITILTAGSNDAKEQLKELLAMGADEAIIVKTPENADYNITSNLLAGAIKKIKDYDMIICGEASIDLFSSQIGPRIAVLLGIPEVAYAQNITVEKNRVITEKNLGDSVVTIETQYPILLTVTREINQPRLPSLMSILASSSKTIQEWSASDIIHEEALLQPKTIIREIKGISMHRKNIIYKEDVDKSVNMLVNELAKEGVLR
ncbi:MAG: electron transfer flavoprotein subunit beta/FixA family protein [Candidatus Thermoplasmatota archaeon]